MIQIKKTFLFLTVVLITSSCRYYKAHIMFQTEESIIVNKALEITSDKNYIIQKGDIFTMRVSSNDGEILIDPDDMLKKELEIGVNRAQVIPLSYLVLQDGRCKFPMVIYQKIEGLTIDEANTLLEKEYANYYFKPFVSLKLLNRRVVVFTSTGGKVIPLENENMNLLEILALSGEITSSSYSNNIRLIRGDLKNPNVQIIDLSTIEGMRNANLLVQANDVIYVEPKKVLFSKALSQTITPLFGVLNTIVLTVLLFTGNR